jgi:hypothetical protein
MLPVGAAQPAARNEGAAGTTHALAKEHPQSVREEGKVFLVVQTIIASICASLYGAGSATQLSAT